MKETIITVEEARTLARPLSMNDDKVRPYIVEVEQTQIKQSLGASLFRDLHNEEIANKEVLSVLLNGGEYEDSCGNLRIFAGLKVAVAYLVYVKSLMSGDIESTRYGFMQKDGQYSQHISNEQRSAAYNEAMEIAQCYLKECMDYCKSKKLIKPLESRRGIANAGCIIRKIC